MIKIIIHKSKKKIKVIIKRKLDRDGVKIKESCLATRVRI